jgi:hypothetical protein
MSRLERLEAVARDIAVLLDGVIQRKGDRCGFGLLVFDFGEHPDMTWISNAAREDMDRVLRELLARWDADQQEGRVRYQRPVKPPR